MARTRTLLSLAALVVALTTACSSEDPESAAPADVAEEAGDDRPELGAESVRIDVDDGSGQAVDGDRAIGCPAEPGSPTDLDAEPTTWLAFDTYLRWVDGERCSVRIDVISHTRGAEACGYEAAEFITIGRPLGISIDGAPPGDIARYVWDPAGALPGGPWGQLATVGELPPAALDTGYRRDGAELWLDEQAGQLYRIVGDRAQVWHGDDTGLGLCG